MTETKKLNADEGVLIANDEEIDVTGFKHDPPDESELHGGFDIDNYKYEGTATVGESDMPEDAPLTVKNDDGTEQTFENVEIKTQEQVQQERQEPHERAPERIKFDEVDGCSDPTDIDELITFLQEAKEQGAEWVNVNDDGREMEPRPQITNSYKEYWQGPKPSECVEYVVL